jgi:MFS family permease
VCNVTHMHMLPRIDRLAPHLAFASFGVFWGSWGALLPSVKAQAGLTDGQLGTSLLFVGMGALPTMLFTGRLIDRLGGRVSAGCLALLSATAVIVAVGSQGPSSVAVCMLLVGATSGAADVAINTLAGESERRASRPVLTRAHGVFSLAVVVSSLGIGGLGAVGASLLTSLSIAAATALGLSVLVWTGAPPRHADRREAGTGTFAGPRVSSWSPAMMAFPLVALGIVGALAYATENAHQSWGAVLITDVFDSPGLAVLAPATFAASAAITRLGLAPLSRKHPVLVLTGGGAVATAGTLVLATAADVPTALCGLAIAASGTAMLFPTLLSHGLRSVAPEAAGRATSIVATTAYLGYLAGPAFVGLLADQAGIRAAFAGVALVMLTFTATVALTCRVAHDVQSRPTVVGKSSLWPRKWPTQSRNCHRHG